jgi:probable rRNA maturation factor
VPQYSIEITGEIEGTIADHSFLKSVVERVLSDELVECATISLALVDDAKIHEINRQFLGHDYPTDVISFRLDDDVHRTVADQSEVGHESVDPFPRVGDSEKLPSLTGELIVSTETAIREAVAHGWSPRAELVLYVVHGLLHLCGYDDLTDEARPAMRSRERELLRIWGFSPTGLEA